MSISNILKDGKLVEGVLPNPYPFPASASGLGAVLAVNNSALTPTGPPVPQSITDVGTLSAANIQAPFGSILALNSDLIQNGVSANLGILPAGNLSLLPGNNLTLKGAQTKGSMLVGNGTNTAELVAPALPNGSVLILDSTQPLGVRWGGESGPIATITAGNNIDILGTSANPIVAFQSPTTSNIVIGVGTEIQAKDNYTTPTFSMSIDSTGLNDKYDVGGVVNQEDISVSATNVVQTLSTTDGSNYTNNYVLDCSPSSVSRGVSATNNVSGYSGANNVFCSPTSSNVSCGISYPVAPFGSVAGDMSINCNYNGSTIEPSLSLSSSGPFLPSFSTTLDKNGISSAGANGFTINSNATNITLTNTAIIELQSTNLISDANKLEVRSTNVGGQANPLLVLQNTNNTAGAVAIETYKNDAPTSTGGDVISSLSSYCNALVSGVATKVEMTRISSLSQGVGTNNNDGTIVLACKVNSSLAPQNFLVCNGGIGTGEIVVSKPISAASATNLDLFCGTAGGTINLNSVSSVDITAAGDNLTLTAGTLTLIDTPILELANVPTTTSTPTFTASIATTSAIGDTNQFLKLKLNGNDIWIPYFTTDPSL